MRVYCGPRHHHAAGRFSGGWDTRPISAHVAEHDTSLQGAAVLLDDTVTSTIYQTPSGAWPKEDGGETGFAPALVWTRD
jgi:hypothetical protein